MPSKAPHHLLTRLEDTKKGGFKGKLTGGFEPAPADTLEAMRKINSESKGPQLSRVFIYLFILLFRAAPVAYGGSQARGTATAVWDPSPCLQPTPPLTATPDP